MLCQVWLVFKSYGCKTFNYVLMLILFLFSFFMCLHSLEGVISVLSRRYLTFAISTLKLPQNHWMDECFWKYSCVVGQAHSSQVSSSWGPPSVKAGGGNIFLGCFFMHTSIYAFSISLWVAFKRKLRVIDCCILDCVHTWLGTTQHEVSNSQGLIYFCIWFIFLMGT